MYSSEDPAAEVAEVQREVRWMRRRPLLAGVVLLALLGFSYWFVAMGGGASGSAAQAEQAIRNATATAPGQPISGSQVVTVRCSENGASMLARLASIFQGGSASEQQRATPATYYSCSGTTVDGTAMDWCVGFPPKSAPGNVPPQVLIRQPGGNCPT